MKKNLFILATTVLSNFAFSQVGINTPDPKASLDIQSKGNTAITKALRINNSDDAEMMTVTDAGKIGIGKINPEGQLHVRGTAENGIISERAVSGNSVGPYIVLRRNKSDDPDTNLAVAANDFLGTILFSGNTGNGYEGSANSSNSGIVSRATQNFSPTTKGSELMFRTVPNGTAASQERMKIANNGNVGIGTSTPHSSAILDISSNNKGFLPPRVILQSETDATSIPSPSKGLLVYHLALGGGMAEGIYVNTGNPNSPVWSRLEAQNSQSGSTTGKFSYPGQPNPSVTTKVGNLEFRFAETGTTVNLQMRMIAPPTVNTTYECNRISWFGNNITTSIVIPITFTPANYSTWQNYSIGNKNGAGGVVSFLTYISSLQDTTFYESRVNSRYGSVVPANQQFWSKAVTAY